MLLRWIENSLVYPASPAAESWVEHTAFQDVWRELADGNRIHCWWLPGPPDSDVIVLCHGNGGNLSHRGNLALVLARTLNCAVLLFDYPGYGKSTGNPSEAGCYAAGDAAVSWLISQGIPENRMFLFGESLGGGVATELAVRRTPKALILVKTFTTLPEAARTHFPFLPVRTVMSNRFDNAKKIGLVKCPVFVAHGTSDTVVPFRLGRALFNAAHEPKTFHIMENADHNDPLPVEFFAALERFLRGS